MAQGSGSRSLESSAKRLNCENALGRVKGTEDQASCGRKQARSRCSNLIL
jgi:hypothetical protein